MYRRKLPPNLRLWRPCCQFSDSRASTVVSQARIGVAAYVSPIPEKPWTLNHGAPQASGPPKPMPRIPSCETMSLLNALCVKWLMARRENVGAAMFTRFSVMMRFHARLPCCEKSSWLVPHPGKLMGMHPCPELSEERAESVLLLEKMWSTRTVP